MTLRPLFSRCPFWKPTFFCKSRDPFGPAIEKIVSVNRPMTGSVARTWMLLLFCLIPATGAFANIAGGGNGTGANVTITTNTSAGTVTMANGIVTAVISIYSSQILQLTYIGQQVTDGGTSGTSAFYWQGQNSVGEQTGAFGILSVVVDPATNSGNYAEISIANLYTNQGTTNAYVADAYYHFSMFRGSPGIYVTEIMSRPATYPAGAADIPSFTCKLGADIFNWAAQDTGRNLLQETAADLANATPGINNAPKEVTLLNQGLLAGRFDCKYDFAGDLGLLSFSGWCSTNQTTNFGLWCIRPSFEYDACGPKHPEIIDQLDMINVTFKGVHFGFGSDLQFAAGETWTKVCGPIFLYFNQVPQGTANPQVPLYADAFAQAAAEKSVWPYSWLADTNFVPPSGRGTVAGQIVVADSGNPNASAAGLWVGVMQQPPSSLDPPTTDFQNFAKNYQFWVKTDTNGDFVVPNVIAGTNYTLLAFGPGAIGLFQSQSFGTAPPVALYIPPTPFSITVTGGQTTNLGIVTWTPPRVGATVWEIGVPDRDTTEFRHGADYWHGDLGNTTNFPVNWGQWQNYNLDFPAGVNYTVGQSRWSADWDYAQPTSLDPTTGNLNPTTQNIFFNLPSAPAADAQASIYFAIAGDYSGPVIVTVNGTNVTSPSTGFSPYYSDDPMIRMESHGIFCDYRLNFAGNLLHQGLNEIQLEMRKGGYFSDSVLYDYIRLELTGYVPPTPAGLTAIAGNGLVVLDWPASSGATSYNVLRSTTTGGGYTAIATNVTGPVVGSDVPDATYTDNSVANGTTYYYVVAAVNPNGQSSDSIEANATPSAGTPPAPPAPTGLTATPGNLQATLNWNASSGAATYTIQRTALTTGAVVTDPDGSAPTITVNSFVTGTNYTDTGLANNVAYSYTVSAANANGQSAPSTPAIVTPEPAIPPAPAGLAATVNSNQVSLSWNVVSTASSYVLQRATSSSGPYTAVDYPAWLTIFTDTNVNYNTTYYYEVASANLAGIGSNSAPLSVTTGPAPPASITAVPGNAQVSLSWSASAGATNYVLQRSTTSGGPYATVVSTANTSYLDTGLSNGTTYYYVVYAVGPYGQSPLSAQASATPSGSVIAGLVWSGAAGSAWDTTTTNWLLGQTATVYSNGDNVTFNDSSATALVVITNAVSPGAVTFANSTVNYTVTNVLAGISGAASLVKSNAGTVTLSGPNSNSYSGGTVVTAGQLVFSVGAAIPASGTVTLTGTGAVTVISASSLTNVAVNGTNTITGNGNSGTGIATLNDAGVLNLAVSGGSKVFDLTGSMTGSGTLALATSGMTLRFNGTAGDGAAIFNLGTGTAVANVRATETTAIALGGLTGGSGTQLQGDNSAGGDNMRYTIGGANANTEFDGIIKDGTVGTVAITKTGTGTLTLTSTNFYSGGTTVSNGTLLVNNTSGSGTGSGSVTVNGGTLSGTGVIAGSVVVNSGGALSPGNPLGTLTISNNLVVNSGAVLAYELGTNSALTVVSSNLTLGGTLNVSNAGGFGAGTYELFGYGKTLTYNGVSLGSAPVGYNYAINTNTSGRVSLVVTVPLSAFQQWQMNYFGCTNCAQAAPDADPLGKGISNTNQFLLGLNPTNAASVFRILSVAQETTDVVITWAAGAGRTNVVQATAGDANGGYTNNFSDISGLIILSGSGDVTNSYTDVGGATYIPSRYYRIRLGP